MHANGFVPIRDAAAGTKAWNLATCGCGGLKDWRARCCRRCTRVGTSKWCSGCSTTKPITAFYKRLDRGYQSRCRECLNVYQRQRMAAGKRAARNYKAAAARITHRRHTEVTFRLAERLRATIRTAIKRQSGIKAAKTMALLGCSVADFVRHIERQWHPGMSWKNWGTTRECWHLDHIKPVSSFDLTDSAQQAACFRFSNYQPLWAPDNVRKGNALSWPS